MKIPIIINTKPIILPIVKVSPNSQTPKMKTMAGAKLIKGYATVISNLLIAAIQNIEAINAAIKPDKIYGSINNLAKDKIISVALASGIVKCKAFSLHLRIICP